MLREIDRLLRAEGRYAVDGAGLPWRRLAWLVVGGGFIYGVVMGTFGAGPLQSFYSGIKVPILLLASTLVCLPNFFILNTILGLREDFAAACRGVLATQATVAICLACLTPLTLLAYASSADYEFAIVINGVYFAVATLAGQMTLHRHYKALIAGNRRHRITVWTWIVLYVFVAIQLAWVLRPYVGSPGLPVRFFRPNAWSNAYVVVVNDVLSLFGAGH